jgi:hypothetical protein
MLFPQAFFARLPQRARHVAGPLLAALLSCAAVDGHAQANGGTADAIEYFHAGLGHYFITAFADEAAFVDGGAAGDWIRTGLSFKVYPASASGLYAVCRFYSARFAQKSTHFYTPFAEECAALRTNLDWQFEGHAFYVPMPDGAGACPSGTLPVHRLYNNNQGGAPNHRYTTSSSVRNQMLSAGWIAEGYGATGVTFCAPEEQTVIDWETRFALQGVPASTTGPAAAYASSTRLLAGWQAPVGLSVSEYRLTLTDGISGAQTVLRTAATEVMLTNLKSDTFYTASLLACTSGGAQCYGATQATASGRTAAEIWQLQGSGNSVAGLSRIVSDGNARISATRFGPQAGNGMANRLQLYYGPMMTAGGRPSLSVAVTATATSAADPPSHLHFTSLAGSTGLISPSTASALVKQVATGQGVPLSEALGGAVRLFFEADGADGKTRILSLDSHDGHRGRDFNRGGATTCSTAADYGSGGGCAPTVVIGVEGDATRPSAGIRNARQHKVAWATLDDWRWDGAAGSFMVFTTDSVPGCSSHNMNHGYAVWDGSNWNVQYRAEDGCPKLFTSAQAAFPMHLGGVRYKLYYGDPSVSTGRIAGSRMPFLGPKKLIYADGATTGEAGRVDFEDWEARSAARGITFVWPNGEVLNDTAEGYIDDYHFLTPTGSLDLQVMYLAITAGTEPPIGAAAVLVNP